MRATVCRAGGRLLACGVSADLDEIFMISMSGRHVPDPSLGIPQWGICLVLIDEAVPVKALGSWSARRGFDSDHSHVRGRRNDV